MVASNSKPPGKGNKWNRKGKNDHYAPKRRLQKSFKKKKNKNTLINEIINEIIKSYSQPIHNLPDINNIVREINNNTSEINNNK